MVRVWLITVFALLALTTCGPPPPADPEPTGPATEPPATTPTDSPIRPAEAKPTCDDRVKNQDEIDVDCGGACDACPAPPSCTDEEQNGNETGVDCGGDCNACPAPPSCTDGLHNGSETGIDCGADCGGCVDDTCFGIEQSTCAPTLLCIDTHCSATPRVEPECEVKGAPGQCIGTASCAALGNHVSTAGHCPGPADIQCCTKVGNTADNPPVPAGYQLMHQADVTSEMTTWAVAILHDPSTYPLFSSVLRQFGALTVLAIVQWHPPDFQVAVVHRGVTLFEPK